MFVPKRGYRQQPVLISNLTRTSLMTKYSFREPKILDMTLLCCEEEVILIAQLDWVTQRAITHPLDENEKPCYLNHVDMIWRHLNLWELWTFWIQLISVRNCIYRERGVLRRTLSGSLPSVIPSKPSRPKASTSCSEVARCLETNSWWELRLYGLQTLTSDMLYSAVYLCATHRKTNMLNILVG